MKYNVSKRITSILVACIMLIGLLPVTVFAAVTVEAADVIIGYPVHLANPDGFAQIYGGSCQIDTSINSDGYVNGVRWKNLRNGAYMSENDTFVGGRDYELSICLITKNGYAFLASRTAITVNGEATALVIKDVNHARATLTLIADELYINYVDIVGLNYPTVGDTPDTTFGTADENCTIMDTTWTDLANGSKLSHGAKFVTGHAYKLSFELWAYNGYIFPNNVTVYVSGKLATVTKKSDYEIKVSVEFPALAEQMPTHTHTPSAWRTTGIYHYKACTTCGDFLEQEDHRGGVATCNEKGKCTVCGCAYIEENEDHVPDTDKWIQRGDMYHYHACKICGAHCDIEDHRWSPSYHSVGSSGHAYECADCHAYSAVLPHEPGPTGTPDAEVVCRDCGYVIAPPIGHEHNLSKVTKKDATCVDPGNIEYYVCGGCSCLFADDREEKMLTKEETVIPPSGHATSDTWEYNGDYHWRICTTCKTVLPETKMAHKMTDGKCVDCAYEYTSDNTTSENKNTASGYNGNIDNGNIDNGKSDEDNGSDIFIIITVILVLAILGVTAYVIVKKKKS